ncbi:hypothetical protein [Streptomyces erythrochromogenes]|uniref:hypothetical protein n=1 Tax=Streptomyces erythrochromogenes TaxID=285574 RepID=UPI003865B5A5|nr:hypothetical protein OG489_37820 [Streptomyces erythrochromogenes]
MGEDVTPKKGESTDSDTPGIQGRNTVTGVGVEGQSELGIGVYGRSEESGDLVSGGRVAAVPVSMGHRRRTVAGYSSPERTGRSA